MPSSTEFAAIVVATEIDPSAPTVVDPVTSPVSATVSPDCVMAVASMPSTVSASNPDPVPCTVLTAVNISVAV